MKRTRIGLLAVLAVALFAMPGRGQTGEHPVDAEQQPEPLPPVQAGSEPVTADIALRGLGVGNEQTVRELLGGMQEESFVCADCGSVAAETGSCPACGVDRLPRALPVLVQVSLDLPGGRARVVLGQARTLSLQDVAKLLQPVGVTVDPARQPIQDGTLLWFAGVTGKSLLGELEARLTSPGYFGSVQTKYRKQRRAAFVRVWVGATPVSHAKLLVACRELGDVLDLIDVVWGQQAANAFPPRDGVPASAEPPPDGEDPV